jgi:hypothetical protein
MSSIERPQVMIPVERIKPFVQEPPHYTLGWRKSAAQNITVEEVLEESPSAFRANDSELLAIGGGVFIDCEGFPRRPHVVRQILRWN